MVRNLETNPNKFFILQMKLNIILDVVTILILAIDLHIFFIKLAKINIITDTIIHINGNTLLI